MANASAQLLGTSITSSFRTTGLLWVNTSASLNRRYAVYEINVGQAASGYNNTDCGTTWDVSRIGATASAAGSSFTPNLLDPADAAILGQYLQNLTAEAVVTTAGNGLSLYNWPVNQRGFNRWRALDDGDQIIIPATAQFGLAVRALSPGGGVTGMSYLGTMAFIER